MCSPGYPSTGCRPCCRAHRCCSQVSSRWVGTRRRRQAVEFVRRCFNEHDIPALDYLARLRVVNAVSLGFLTVTAEPALPGFVAQPLGVGLDTDESSCADYREKAQVCLFAVDFLVRGLHAKS